jgi:hypothetical protein
MCNLVFVVDARQRLWIVRFRFPPVFAPPVLGGGNCGGVAETTSPHFFSSTFNQDSFALTDATITLCRLVRACLNTA